MNKRDTLSTIREDLPAERRFSVNPIEPSDMMNLMKDLVEEVKSLKQQNAENMLNQEIQNHKIEEQLKEIRSKMDLK